MIKNFFLVSLVLLVGNISWAGKVARTQEAFRKYPKINIQMEIKPVKDKDTKSEPLYSVGGGQRGYVKKTRQNVFLEIDLRNLGVKTVGPFILEVEILGNERKVAKAKDGTAVLNTDIQVGPLKRGESRKIITNKAEFISGTAYGRFSNFMGTERKGKRFSGYNVKLIYKDTVLLTGSNR
ncbi:MAG: hypothetical protein P9M03_12505 [Candidatus Theseobacter exili]|nr:hypothetical protein [Candidatus Theseobacter exili]